uniref:Uncharacterized protein n=3 Tax=Clytia hemisphaerica TaxID=252671 RepID=A0A7M5WY32_9CNID
MDNICEVTLAKSIQRKMLDILFTSQNLDQNEDVKNQVTKLFKLLNTTSSEILVHIQILLKIKKELNFAKLDLQRSSSSGNKESKEYKRVKWLESRLDYISTLCHEKCASLDGSMRQEIIRIESGDSDVIDTVQPFLSQMTRDSIIESCYCRRLTSVEKAMVQNLKDELQDNPSLTTLSSDSKLSESSITKLESSGMNSREAKSPEQAVVSSLKSFEEYQDATLGNLVAKFQKFFNENEDGTLSKKNTFTKSVTFDRRITKNFTGSESNRSGRSSNFGYNYSSTCQSPQSLQLGVNVKAKVQEKPSFFSHLPRITEDIPTEKEDKSKVYPRSPVVWCDKGQEMNKIQRTVKPRKKGKSLSPAFQDLKTSQTEEELEEKRKIAKRTVMVRIKAVNKLKGLKKKNITQRELDKFKAAHLSRLCGPDGLKSDNNNIAIDAAKSAGALLNPNKELIALLKETVRDEGKVWLLRYESAKALLHLEIWDAQCMEFLASTLISGNAQVKLDLLETIRETRNGKFLHKNDGSMLPLRHSLVSTMKDGSLDLEVRVEAALALAHLCIKNSYSKELLLKTLDSENEKLKSRGLSALVKQLNIRNEKILQGIMDQLKSAIGWKIRMQASLLLQKFSLQEIEKFGDESLFDCLHELLWNHPSQEFRRSIASLVERFGMKDDVYKLVLRKLEDRDESVRAEGIISLATLQVKTERELKILLDILELDSSTYVRAQVIRTFVALQWVHPRVIRALQERQRNNADFLSEEAEKALKVLLACTPKSPSP